MKYWILILTLVGISSKSMILDSAIQVINEFIPYKLKAKDDLKVEQTEENYYDFNFTRLTAVNDYGDVGFELESDFDLSLGYTTPWANEDHMIVIDIAPHILLGGLLHIIFHLYMIKVHTYINVVASKITLDVKTKLGW